MGGVTFSPSLHRLKSAIFLTLLITISDAEPGVDPSLPSQHLTFASSYSFGGSTNKCPISCICSGTTVDCSHRGLNAVPKGIPLDTERLKHSWTTDLTKNLIVLYENYPCLYDTRIKEDHNKTLRTKALAEICQNLLELNPEVHVTEEMVKTKIHVIRTQYMAEINKIKKSEASGVSKDEVYLPKLWCFEMLGFLSQSTNVLTQGESNLALVQEDSSQDDNEEESEIIFEGSVDDLEQATPTSSRASSSTDLYSSKSRKRPTETTQEIPKSKRRKDENLENIFKETSEALRKISQPAEKEDNITMFCRYIASEMKNISGENVLDDLKQSIIREIFKAKSSEKENL